MHILYSLITLSLALSLSIYIYIYIYSPYTHLSPSLRGGLSPSFFGADSLPLGLTSAAGFLAGAAAAAGFAGAAAAGAVPAGGASSSSPSIAKGFAVIADILEVFAQTYYARASGLRLC